MSMEENRARKIATGQGPNAQPPEAVRQRGETDEETRERMEREAEKERIATEREKIKPEVKKQFETKPTEERPSVEPMPQETPVKKPMKHDWFTEAERKKAEAAGIHEGVVGLEGVKGRNKLLEEQGSSYRYDESTGVAYSIAQKPKSRGLRLRQKVTGTVKGEVKRFAQGPEGLRELEKLPSKEVAKKIGERVSRGFERVGQGSLLDVETKASEKGIYKDGVLTGKVVTKTTTESFPYWKDTMVRDYTYAAQNGRFVLQGQPQITSHTRVAVPAKERYALEKKNIESVLNGADIQAELTSLSSKKYGLLNPSPHGYRLPAKEKAEKGEPIAGTTRSSIYGRYLVSSPWARERGAEATATHETRMAAWRERVAGARAKAAAKAQGTQTTPEEAETVGQEGIVTPQELSKRSAMALEESRPQLVAAPAPAPLVARPARNNLSRQTIAPQNYLPIASTTRMGSKPSVYKVPADYIPQRSGLAESYRNQVARYVGSYPRVTGFVNPSEAEESLAWPLARAQKRMDIPVMLITMPSTKAFLTIGGFRHSLGPTHDLANQIFEPRYAMKLMGAGKRFNAALAAPKFRARSDVLGLFLGSGKSTPKFRTNSDVFGLFTGRKMK